MATPDFVDEALDLLPGREVETMLGYRLTPTVAMSSSHYSLQECKNSNDTGVWRTFKPAWTMKGQPASFGNVNAQCYRRT